MRSITLTGDDDASTVVVLPGDRLKVLIEENPSTGYRWTVAPGSGGGVPLAETRFLVDDDAGPGAGGKREFLFTAVEPGRTVIELLLCRPWEGTSAPHTRFAVTVEVRSPEDSGGRP